MNDEIKEILDEMKQICDVWVIMEGGVKTYNQDQIHCIYDYITNLQEDYEKEHYLVDKLTRQLTDEYKNTEYQCKQKEIYKSRIDKAVEYIENDLKSFLYSIEYKTLLNILQGSDK